MRKNVLIFRSFIEALLASKQWHTDSMIIDLCAVQGGKFVDGDCGQFAIGQFKENDIAKNFVIEIPPAVQSVTSPLGAHYGSVRFCRPSISAHGNCMLDLDPIARFQFVEKRV
jgi:hypothetical protein